MPIEAMPILTRDPKSGWARSTEVRDRVYEDVENTCQQLGVDALVNKSTDFAFPAWVSIEAWLPAGTPGATYRRFCVFYIDPKPHFRFPFELRIECSRDEEKKAYGPFTPQKTNSVGEWVKYTLDQGAKPNKMTSRIRKFPWQFWYPKNEVTGLGYDFINLGRNAGVVVAVIGFALSGPVPMIGFPLGLLGIAAVIGCYVITFRRQKVFINVGRPIAEPRSLQLVDSWQTIVCDLGNNWESARTRLFRRLTEGRAFDIKPRLENISYLTPDGKQTRQQLVLTQGRGIVFCHAYPYGNDMFVGWEAYLNYGQWLEHQLATGFDPRLQSPVVLRTVQPGRYRPTEYDVIDLNGLTEWTHTRVVQVVKQILAEHKLSQEIDFKITQRGARGGLVARQEAGSERRPLFSRDGNAQPGGPATFTGSS